MRSKKSAVTLYELLVVMAIIAILVVLLANTFRGTTVQAKSTVTKANLHQIQLALTMYQTDQGDFPPNNIQYEGFLPYLGGKIPMPPLAPPQDQWPKDRIWHYFLHARTSGKEMKDADECKERRGPSFPVAHDPVFADPIFATPMKKTMYYYARMDGSIGSFNGNGFILDVIRHPDKYPCPGMGPILNLP